MGYSYGTNWITGRTCLACDICGASNGNTTKIRCPYGYCPATATCKNTDCKEKIRGYKHETCKKAMDQYEQDKAKIRAGGLDVTIASGNWHCSPAVHGLYYIISPRLDGWSDSLGAGVWYEKDELTTKLQALGHTVRLVDDKEAERIVYSR